MFFVASWSWMNIDSFYFVLYHCDMVKMTRNARLIWLVLTWKSSPAESKSNKNCCPSTNIPGGFVGRSVVVFFLYYFPTSTLLKPESVKTFPQTKQWHITKLQIDQESRNITQQPWKRRQPKIPPSPTPRCVGGHILRCLLSSKLLSQHLFQSLSHLNALCSDTIRELLSRQSPRQLSINSPSRWTEIDNVLNPTISQGPEEGMKEERKWVIKEEWDKD